VAATSGCAHDWDALRPYSGLDDASVDLARDTGRDRVVVDLQTAPDMQTVPDVQTAADVPTPRDVVVIDIMLDRSAPDTGTDVPADRAIDVVTALDAGPEDTGPRDIGPADLAPVPCTGAAMSCACSAINPGGYCRPGETCTGGRCLAGTLAGSLVITEVMNDPSAVADTAGEWFEVYNPGATPLDLRGLRITSMNDMGSTIPMSAEPVVLAAMGHAVFAISATTRTNGGVTVLYAYGSSMILGNSATDSIVLDLGNAMTEIDRVVYTTAWPRMAGRAKSLRPDMRTATANDNVVNWCDAPTQWMAPGSDHGSPGVVNPSCP
jgi:hypothetical protein